MVHFDNVSFIDVADVTSTSLDQKLVRRVGRKKFSLPTTEYIRVPIILESLKYFKTCIVALL